MLCLRTWQHNQSLERKTQARLHVTVLHFKFFLNSPTTTRLVSLVWCVLRQHNIPGTRWHLAPCSDGLRGCLWVYRNPSLSCSQKNKTTTKAGPSDSDVSLVSFTHGSWEFFPSFGHGTFADMQHGWENQIRHWLQGIWCHCVIKTTVLWGDNLTRHNNQCEFHFHLKSRRE